jgi:hypothetical protein
LYSYDGEQQISSYQRGTLNANDTGLVGSASDSQSYTTDAVGNFTNVTTNSTQQARTVNLENELTQVGSSYPAYDANGNLTTDANGNTLIYDAWNDLHQVKSGSSVAWVYGFQGQRTEVSSGLNYVRHRDYDPALMR